MGPRSKPCQASPILAGRTGSQWGRLFQNWESEVPNETGYSDIGEERPGVVRGTFKLLWMALKILATCIREAPEVAARRRRRVARRPG